MLGCWSSSSGIIRIWEGGVKELREVRLSLEKSTHQKGRASISGECERLELSVS